WRSSCSEMRWASPGSLVLPPRFRAPASNPRMPKDCAFGPKNLGPKAYLMALMSSTRKMDGLNLRILNERGCAMYTEILNNDELVELRAAYEKACEELRLGMNGEDTVRREQLALVMLSLAKVG